MTFKYFCHLIRSDLHRVAGASSFSLFLNRFFLCPGFIYCFWLRACAFCHARVWFRYTLYPIARLMLRHYSFKFGIIIPWQTTIGSGLYIGHFGGIVVNEAVIIGKNCNLSPGVSLGRANRGERIGTPIIGDSVYFGPGAKVVGQVKIGHHVAVGANCVVTKDIPDNAIVVGVPGKIISYQGSQGYINRTNYPAAENHQKDLRKR